MTRLKYKLLSSLFAVLLMLMSVPTVTVSAAVPPTVCGSGAHNEGHTENNPGWCICNDSHQVVDETDSENCKDHCPSGAHTMTAHGQKYCESGGGASVTNTPSPTVNCQLGDTPTACSNGVSDPANGSCGSNCDIVGTYLNGAIKLFSALVGIFVVISIILGAIQYTTSEGDPQKAAKAKGRIVNSIFALIVFLFLYALLQFLIPGGVLHP